MVEIYVYQSPSEAPACRSKNTVVIESVLDEINEDRYQQIHERLWNLDISSGTNLPIYTLSKNLIIEGFFSQKTASLCEYVILIKKLKQISDQNKHTDFILKSIHPRYEPVFQDLAELDGINIRRHQSGQYSKLTLLLSNLRVYFLSAFLSLGLIVDQVIGYVLNYFRELPKADVLFIPNLSRLRSTTPVIQQLRENNSLVPMTIVQESYITELINQHSVGLDLNLPSVYRQHSITSLHSIIRQSVFLLDYLISELWYKKTQHELANQVSTEFDIPADSIASHIFQQLHATHLAPKLQQYYSYQKILQKTDANVIVVSIGYSPTSEAIWLAARQENAIAVDLPHTVLLNPPKSGIYSHYTFVAGQYEYEYAQANYNHKLQNTIALPTGRPYLERLSTTVENSQDVSKPVKILIATQPFSSDTRRQFIKTAIDSIRKSPVKTEILIKPHPSENASFYRDIDIESSIKIISQLDVWPYLNKADVVISLNSNVGLEAIVADSLSIVINLKYFPHRNLPYATHPAVPILDTHEKAIAFMESLSIQRIRNLKNNQKKLIKSRYNLDDATTKVASRIEKMALLD